MSRISDHGEYRRWPRILRHRGREISIPFSNTKVGLGLNTTIAAVTRASGRKQSPPRGHKPSGPAATGPMTKVTTRPIKRTATVIGFAGIGRYEYRSGPRSRSAIDR